MLVHAHPDDEVIGTGVTMAKYVAEGAQVSLVTCTLGEEGEVLIPDIAHLAADKEDDLGQHRHGELTNAMSVLGVTDFQQLGGIGRYRDSGMAWDEQRRAVARDVLRDGIFWTADLLEAANDLVSVIRDRRPQVLITYDEYGLYGHPDHIQAHRVAMYAYILAGAASYRPDLGAAWTIQRVLWTAMSESEMREGIRLLRAAGDTESWGGADPDGEMPPMASPDSAIDAEVDGQPYAHLKIEAMRAHASQVETEGWFFEVAKVLGDRAWAREFYRLAAGQPFPQTDGWADDLFAGLE
nr:N-acetyl-1-D-myo-inositol-2-amino-2-deoxy-alpha-D-glucopyranoside deacetylase [Microlunatus panaciterrae]